MRARVAVVVAAGLLAGVGAARADETWAVTAEGGVGDYTGVLGSSLRLGGVWGVRVERFALPMLQVGVAYVGGANELAGTGSSSPPVLQRDGGEISVKALLLPGRVRPYVEAGAGLARFHVRQGDPGPDLHGATSVTLPLGVGVQAYAGALRVGAGVGTEFLSTSPSRQGGGARLDASLQIGARF